MKKKKLFIGCSIALGVFILLLVAIGFFAYRYYISPLLSSRIEMPEELKSHGVLLGSDFLSKDIFYANPNIGTVSDIVFGEFDPSYGSEIGLAGTKGVVYLDENITVKSFVKFTDWSNGRVVIIDVDGDNISEYLDRGGGWQEVSLIDHKGNTIWTYGKWSGVDNITSGDIDGDGILEFVVGFNGGRGVKLLDRNAKEKWKQPDGNVWHVELVDTDDDGNLEIVHSNAAGQITVRDTEGKVIERSKPDIYFSDFSLSSWPKKNSRKYALIAENDTIWLFDFYGKIVAQFNAPISGSLGDARGVSTKIVSDQPEYFAVIVEFSTWDKSVLYIYGSDKILVYQEIIPEACASLASISIDATNKEILLLGCNGKVWEYSLIN
jgi:hypothetical protein